MCWVYVLFFWVGSFNAFANTKEPFVKKIEKIELSTQKDKGRLGFFAINTENNDTLGYRSEETFPTQCTSKVMGVSAVLRKTMSETSLLGRKISYSDKDLAYGQWSPITRKYRKMTVGALCSAAISLSDNTAMNLLLKIIGGLRGINDFARSLGDTSFRQDHDWPAEAYSGGAGNLDDASTPQAMVQSFRAITLGNILGEYQKNLLIQWLTKTETGAERIRSGVPYGWVVGNKTGTGAAYGSTNDIAMIWPPNHKPILIGLYYTSNIKKAKKREDLLSSVTRLIIEEFSRHDKKILIS